MALMVEGKEKYYKAGDLDDFQEALQEGSKEKEYTTPEDMVEDYSEKDTDKGTNSYKSDDSGFMSEEDEFDFENEDDDWEYVDYSEKDTDKGDDSGFMLKEEGFDTNNPFGGTEDIDDLVLEDWVAEDDDLDWVDDWVLGEDGDGGDVFGSCGDEEYGWRNRFKDLNMSNKENTDRVCTTLKECFTELAIVGIIMTMFALLINIVMKDDK